MGVKITFKFPSVGSTCCTQALVVGGWGVTLPPDPCFTFGPITLGPQSTFTIKFPSLVFFISQTKGNDSPQSHLQ